MKMIIRNSNGDIQEQELTQDMIKNPTEGEHVYFSGVLDYTFSVSGDTVNLYLIDADGEKILIALKDIIPLIQQNDPLDLFSLDTILGVSTNEAGDKAIEDALNNPEFESGEIVNALKEALSMDSSTVASGAVIDNFGSLLDLTEAAAAGDEPQSTAFLSLNNNDRFDLNDGTSTIVENERPLNPEEASSAPVPRDSSNERISEPYNSVVTLNNVTAVEGSTDVTITATVANPTVTDLIITLDNGATITIKAGETTGTSTPFSVQGDDVYTDPSSETITISGTTGGGYDSLDVTDKSIISVTDTIDDTTVSLSATKEITEAGADVTYTATLTNASQGETKVTLANGETMYIKMSQQLVQQLQQQLVETLKTS